MNYASLQLYNPYYAPLYLKAGGIVPPVRTDKIWDFLEPDYAYTHINTGTPVVAGDGIQHWMSREGKKALGAEIYFSPNFYDTLGTGWTYDLPSDEYLFNAATGQTIRRAADIVDYNKLYCVNDTLNVTSGTLMYQPSLYVGGYEIGASYSNRDNYLQPLTAQPNSRKFALWAEDGSNLSLKINSIKPVDSILAYQSTSTARPIARVDSRGVMYSEWDLVDDSVTAYFDAPITDGEMMIATSVGIWFEKFSTPTNQLDFGPTSFTGGTAGLFDILKDPITNKMHMYARCVMPNREYTAEEKAWLIYLYSAVCGKGLITLGEELKHLFTPITASNGVAEYDDINDIWHITRGAAGGFGGSASYTAQAGIYLRDVQWVSGSPFYFRVDNTAITNPLISADSSTWKGVAIHTSGDIRLNHSSANFESTFRINSVKKVIYP